jgi:putative ABC transport system ATP-binding protein
MPDHRSSVSTLPGLVAAADSDTDADTSAFRLVATDLTKVFSSGPEEVVAVDHVSFQWPRGTMIVVRGPSGCGKSSLLNLIGALDRPTSGAVVVDGIAVEQLSGRSEMTYRLRHVGFVFQSFNLIPYLTAMENVALPMELAGLDGASRRSRARSLLLAVGLKDAQHQHRPGALSGGQQQRVAIARAVANDPAIILADEPTANLDSKTGRVIVKLLRDLSREGRTVIVATHSAAIAQQADLVVTMEDGRLVH